MNEFIIIGDTEEFEGCLVSVCGTSRVHADEVLARMLNNPTDNDRSLMEGHRNLRIKEVPERDCWWNYCTD